MLDRIVTILERTPTDLPTLRNLAYGGSKVALPLGPQGAGASARAWVSSTHTASPRPVRSIAVLTPDDHREALGASDDAVARRLGSVGQPVPGVEVQIRSDDGTVLGAGETGELFVRGDQVSGRYAEIGSVLDAEGWFPTKDVAMLDEGGYLFIGGRSDDTIIRGGENIAPAEIEDVLVEHPDVHRLRRRRTRGPRVGPDHRRGRGAQRGCSPDPDDLREHVRKSLRGSRTPDRVVFREELPTTPTGKVLRRELVAEFIRSTA